MTPEQAAKKLEENQRERAQEILESPDGVERSPDLVSAYRTKVAEHAELAAANWLTDWSKFIDGTASRTDMTRSEVLLWQAVLYQKEAVYKLDELTSMLYSVLVDVRLMHMHQHGLEIHRDCEALLERYKKEPWQE
jgi:DNA-binding transcriptional ArsR family regulator